MKSKEHIENLVEIIAKDYISGLSLSEKHCEDEAIKDYFKDGLAEGFHLAKQEIYEAIGNLKREILRL